MAPRRLAPPGQSPAQPHSGRMPPRTSSGPPAGGTGPREITGCLAVLRLGGAVLLDARRQAILYVDSDRLAASGAMNGDTVLAQPSRGRRGAPASQDPARTASARRLPSGVVVRVLERAHPTVVGTFNRAGRREWLVPDDRRLPVTAVRGGSLGALPGEKVVVAITAFPRAGLPEPSGPVVERLGTAGEPDTETLAIIRSLGLRDTFPEDVLAEADGLAREVRPGELAGRLDLRSETVFTIDDADARDLDDAISIAPPTRKEATWRLGVHIADVSSYVRAGSSLDREARERGTSVYLADRVLPMFPTALSNGIASLHPGPDRLTVSVFMDIDGHGRVEGYEIVRSVIRSVARLTYDAVAALLRPEFGEVLGGSADCGSGSAGSGVSEPGGGGSGPGEPDGDRSGPRGLVGASGPGGPGGGFGAGGPGGGGSGVSRSEGAPEPIPESVAGALRSMVPLAERLRRRRMDRGSLDFDLAEEKAKLDGQGRPLAVVRRPRNIATQLIEEFMIAANETVADYLLWNGVLFIRRIHEEPFRDDLEALREALAPLGYRVPTARAPRPADLQAILEASRDRPEGEEVHKALLKALPQARYSALPGGHFALASANYTHFTSPIRRYPDLTVHRQVVAALEGRIHATEGGPAVEAPRSGDVATSRSRSPGPGQGGPEPPAGPPIGDWLTAVAESSSRAERVAERAEKESLDLMRAELALSCLGSIEEGEVVDVFDFGSFVRLPNGVEGLVGASATGHDLRIGQKVRVQIVRVDVAKRYVDLDPVDGPTRDR